MPVLYARVASFEERRGVRGRRFIAFCCEVRRHRPARSWKLYRRFNDFADLHQRLRQRLGAHHPSLPELPDKMLPVLEREFGERCTKALNHNVQALLNDRELSSSIELLFFLHESSSELIESLSSQCLRLESALDFIQRQLSKIEVDEGGDTRRKIAGIRQQLQQLDEPEEGEASHDIIGSRQLLVPEDVSCRPGVSSCSDALEGAKVFAMCKDGHVLQHVDTLLSLFLPTPESHSHKMEAFDYVVSILQSTFNSQSFAHGSFALKTFLPDSDIDIMSFFSHAHSSTWTQQLVNALCSHANNDKGKLPVRSVTFVNAEVPVIKCQVGNTHVDISANQMNSLAAVALFEEFDRLVGKQHLFKRSLILIKAWAALEIKILGSDKGRMSSFCLRTIVMFLFNAFYERLNTPLDALCRLVSFLSVFDFRAHALGIFGPIKLAKLPRFEADSNGASSWPLGVKPLLSIEVLSLYSPLSTELSTGSTMADGDVESRRCFNVRHLNVLDPIQPHNNLGRSMSRRSLHDLQVSLCGFKQRLIEVAECWAETKDASFVVKSLFPHSLQRYSDRPPRYDRPRSRSSSASTTSAGNAFDLTVNLDIVRKNWELSRCFEMPLYSEQELVDLIERILRESGSIPVGKIGSRMHEITTNHSLPTLMKEVFGGLKKFLCSHRDRFLIGSDHPFNPMVSLLTVGASLTGHSQSVSSKFVDGHHHHHHSSSRRRRFYGGNSVQAHTPMIYHSPGP